MTLITAFANLFGLGGAPLCAMARGKGNREGAQGIMVNAGFMLLLSGAVLTVLGIAFHRPLLYLFGASEVTYPYASSYIVIYLLGTLCVMLSLGLNPYINCQGFARTGMLTVALGAAANIVLDPIFIFALHLGVRGAAIATVLSQFLSAAWVVKFLTGKKAELKLDFRGFCGKVASGVIHKGDEVMALPSGKKSHIKSIVTYDGELEYAFPPQAVTLTLEDEIDVSRGDMLVHADNVPVIDRNFEAMLVWMDEEAMDLDKSFFIKHTTNTGRTRIDSIKYKVDVNTMEHLSVENGKLKKEDLPLQLNQIARVTFTTAKPLFFDSYQKNKACGSFILIDPITNNTSAVGMIIDRVEAKDMLNAMEVPTLNLAAMGIGEEHYEAIEKVVKELDRQGISVKIEK